MYGLTEYHPQPHREAEEQAKKTNIDEGPYSVLSRPQSIFPVLQITTFVWYFHY